MKTILTTAAIVLLALPAVAQTASQEDDPIGLVPTDANNGVLPDGRCYSPDA